MGRKLNFKNKKNYLSYLGYGHATGVFEKTKGNSDIYIQGKKHKVKHITKRNLKPIV